MNSDVFVSRTFHVDTAEGVVEAILRVSRPANHGEGEFRCRYELVAGNERRSIAISGIDELQALLLALRVALVELDSIARRVGGTVRDHELSELRLPLARGAE